MNEPIGEYMREMQLAVALLRTEEIERAFDLLHRSLIDGSGVYLCGNGGSAATASHLAVDLGKNIRTVGSQRMRVISLTDNVPWLTAVANDLSYDDCFSEQLRNYLRPGDLVVGISASGDSENVVRAFELAQQFGADRLALIGFDGGRLARLATSRVWVDSHDYGIVESMHMIVGHVLVNMLTAAMSEPVEGRDVKADTETQVVRERSCPTSAVPVRIAPGGDARRMHRS